MLVGLSTRRAQVVACQNSNRQGSSETHCWSGSAHAPSWRSAGEPSKRVSGLDAGYLWHLLESKLDIALTRHFEESRFPSHMFHQKCCLDTSSQGRHRALHPVTGYARDQVQASSVTRMAPMICVHVTFSRSGTLLQEVCVDSLVSQCESKLMT